MPTHTTDRRTLLGAVAVASIVIATPAGACMETAQWDAVEADYLRIRDRWHLEMSRFAAVEQLHFATPQQATEDEYKAAEAEEGRHCSLDSDAMRRLNETPAPHLRAVLLKLELIEKFMLPMEPVIADVRRLAGEA